MTSPIYAAFLNLEIVGVPIRQLSALRGFRTFILATFVISSLTLTIMRRLTKKGKERARQQVDGQEPRASDYSLVPLTKPNHHRAKQDLPPLVHTYGRQVMTQPFNLPERLNQSGFILGLRRSNARRNNSPTKLRDSSAEPLGSHNEYNNDIGSIDYGVFSTTTQTPSRSQHRVRRESQWTTWLTKTIPSIREAYMNLLHQTKSLRDYPPEPIQHVCKCEKAECRALAVTIVAFTSKLIDI